MKKKRIYLLSTLVFIVYVLHQDFWFWYCAEPFILGFIPIGLFYHAVFSVAAACLMWVLVKYSWPSHLEKYLNTCNPEVRSSTNSPAERPLP